MKIKNKVYIVFVLLIVPFVTSLMSKGYDYSNLNGKFYPVDDIKFLYDLTYKNNGEIKKEQNIFKEQLEIIKEAEDFLILDLFLYNDEYDRDKFAFRNQVGEMTDALIEKRKSNPDIKIIFITDELNNFYGAYKQKHIKRLEDNGIDVTITDFRDIRDSNPLYSGFYKFYIKWMGSPEGGYIRNIFDPKGEKVSIRSFLKLLNFKANHRKVLVSEKCALVTSSNPHDASSNHSNIAIKFYGKAMEDLIKSELGLVEKSYSSIENFKVKDVNNSKTKLRAITEQEIYNALKNNIDLTQKNDKINMAIFYIADRKILKALGNASQRGVEVNIIADLNKDAFGLEKNGSPNRPALSELVDKNSNVNVRWYETNGEQFHAKLTYFEYKNKDPRVILGSANYTRRNLQDYNLETNVEVALEKNSQLYKEIDDYYKRIWNNKGGEFTSPLEDHYEDGLIIRNLWKIQEMTGLCTW